MAASSSLSPTAAFLPLPSRASHSTKPKPLFVSLHCAHAAVSLRFLAPSPFRVPVAAAEPDTTEAEEKSGVAAPSSLDIEADADRIPKQKIRIKLRSYWVPLIEDSCKQILEAARTMNAKTMGPVPLPTKRRVYCVLKSPHVHKDSRFHFEIRTHQQLIDILYPTAQTIDSLMQLDLPAGVDVEVKL
ncbi:small ribosomal subunit protein uS10c-like [Musa acuminata AAA Group]|uniref:small ribosomal subunit protein uS10c-like n=1 Tax=Musa acuminata AAA Group TaxID=214697 RepID=UPI0031CF3942